MSLDEAKDEDKTYDFDGITFLVEPGLLEATEGISICWVQHAFGGGFEIEPKVPLSRGGSSCAGCSC